MPKEPRLVAGLTTGLALALAMDAVAAGTGDDQLLLVPSTGDVQRTYQSAALLPATPWLAAVAADDVFHIAYASPPRLERFDLQARTWYPTQPLAEPPTALHADADGIYIAFGRRVSRFDATSFTETHLRNALYDIRELATMGSYLYLHDFTDIQSVDKWTGALHEWNTSLRNTYSGFKVSTNGDRLFARRGTGAGAIVQIELFPDGTLGPARGSQMLGQYPRAEANYVFPSGHLVGDNSGTVYFTTDLNYANSFGGSFDDLAFYGDVPIVLRGDTISAYSNTLLRESDVVLPNTPLRIVLLGDTIFAFDDDGSGPSVAEIPLASLQPPAPGAPINPVGLPYVPDQVSIQSDGTILLLARAHTSVFRWSLASGGYGPTIPLLGTPTHMTLDEASQLLYLGYSTGEITRVDLGSGQPSEQPFANVPNPIYGIAMAGSYLFVAEPRSSFATFTTFDAGGASVGQTTAGYRSSEYIWNPGLRRMNHFRDGISPNDLLTYEVLLDGSFGTRMDSPYHSSSGIQPPIRVAPDGSTVLLGSGRIYDAASLVLLDTLSTDIVDATWLDGELFTLSDEAGAAVLRSWTAQLGIGDAIQVNGAPLRLTSWAKNLLLVTLESGTPRFTLWDRDLQPLPLDHLFRSSFEQMLAAWSRTHP